MNIALFIHKEKEMMTLDNVIPILVLHIDHNSAISYCKEVAVDRDINYLSLWLLTSKIKEVYMEDIDAKTKRLFEKLGIIVHLCPDIYKCPPLKDFLANL